jgi:hypothetical protein
MAQIKNPNEKLANVGDYAFAVIGDSDGNFLTVILLLRYNQDYLSLYSCDGIMNGSHQGLASYVIRRYPFLSVYDGGWVLDAENFTIGQAIENMTRYHEYTNLGVITSDIPIIRDISVIIERVHEYSVYNPEDIADVIDDEDDGNYDINFISDRYTTDVKYTGYHSYHSHHGSRFNTSKRGDSRYKVGIELEVEFNGSDERLDFTEQKSNWFFCESDGSLGSYGCEIITIPLHPKDAVDIEFWNPLVNSIKHTAESWSTGRCGLHVHVSRTILGNTEDLQTENLGKLLYLYHHHLKDTRVNTEIYGRSRGYNENDGKTKYGDAVATIGKEILKTKGIKDKLCEEMRYKANSTRYFDINVQNSATIEFRKGRGSIKSQRIVSVIEWCTLMCEYVKITPWQQIDYNDFVSWVKIAAKGEGLKRMIDINS